MIKTLLRSFLGLLAAFSFTTILCWNLGNYRSMFVDYYIDGKIFYEGWPDDGPATAVVYVWRNGDIIESFYEPISDDSTMIRTRERAERYVDKLRKNHPD